MDDEARTDFACRVAAGLWHQVQLDLAAGSPATRYWLTTSDFARWCHVCGTSPQRVLTALAARYPALGLDHRTGSAA